MQFKSLLALAMGGTAIVAVGAGIVPASAQDKTMTFLVDNGPSTVLFSEALAKAFEAKNPGLKIDIEIRPGGGEGDNIVKTRLATGEMTDVFLYNSGSLFQALSPEKTLVPITGEDFLDRVQDSFESVVSAGGNVYGVPVQPAMGGGILYNRAIYKDLGLEVPMTWADFMANNKKIKAAGKVPVIGTYRDSWTSQLFVLADFYNVLKAEPDFAERYTANQAKYATSPAALKGFEHLAEVFNAGDMNDDFNALGYQEGLAMLANGEGAHYPMLTFAIPSIKSDYPDGINDIGFFAQPGDSADVNGLTTWMPAGIYIPKTTTDVELAKEFLGFIASVEGCDTIMDAIGASGPFLINGCGLPDDVVPAVKDMLPYFQDEARNAPALEFLSPIKGPSLEQITVEVGSGFRPAEEGAALYDEDVRKQALQLGIAGW